jgi:hypothetical protein
MAYLKIERSDVLELRDWLVLVGPELDRIEAELPTSGPRRRVTVRMLIVGLMIAARHEQTTFLRSAVKHLNRLTERDRMQLQLGDYGKVTERALNQTWMHVTRLVDPTHECHLDAKARRLAERRSRMLTNAIITSSVPAKFRTHGHVAIDTTILPSWAAPESTFSAGNRKKRNDDVKKEPTTSAWSEPRNTRLTGYDLDDYDKPGSTSCKLPVATGPYDCVSACWIGNKNPKKVAYGHGLHVAVTMPDYGGDPDAIPLVALSMDLTRATGNPGEAMMRILHQIRTAGTELGDIAADNAFFPTADHALGVKALGGNPIFHLHASNQQGPHTRDTHALWIDGRPFCPCVPEHLRRLTFPRMPHQAAERTAHGELLKQREKFAFKPHGKADSEGAQRWQSPHHKSECNRCADDDSRCCRQVTVKYSAKHNALVQHEVFGSPPWTESYGRRALVEGFFGVLKIATELRGEHVRFHRHGKLTLAYALMIAATNLHLVKTWRARRAARTANPTAPTRRERRRKKQAADLCQYTPSSDGTLPEPGPPPDPRRKQSILGFLYE